VDNCGTGYTRGWIEVVFDASVTTDDSYCVLIGDPDSPTERMWGVELRELLAVATPRLAIQAALELKIADISTVQYTAVVVDASGRNSRSVQRRRCVEHVTGRQWPL